MLTKCPDDSGLQRRCSEQTFADDAMESDFIGQTKPIGGRFRAFGGGPVFTTRWQGFATQLVCSLCAQSSFLFRNGKFFEVPLRPSVEQIQYEAHARHSTAISRQKELG